MTAVRFYISAFDPAIEAPLPDSEPNKARLLELVGILNDINAGKRPVSDMPLRPGKTIAVWHLRRLSRRGFADLTRVSVGEALRARGELETLQGRATFAEVEDAVRRGLVGVDGLMNGKGPLTLESEPAAGEQTVLKQESLDRLFDAVGARTFDEIGRRVLEITKLDPRYG